MTAAYLSKPLIEEFAPPCAIRTLPVPPNSVRDLRKKGPWDLRKRFRRPQNRYPWPLSISWRLITTDPPPPNFAGETTNNTAFRDGVEILRAWRRRVGELRIFKTLWCTLGDLNHPAPGGWQLATLLDFRRGGSETFPYYRKIIVTKR